MAPSTLPKTKDGRPYLKMKAIRDETGLPASTVQYYHSLGLLYDTVKTSANMAYYHPDTIKRLQLINLLKSRFRLSMSKIRELIETYENNDDLIVIATLNEQIFGPLNQELTDEAGFAEATKLTVSEIRVLVSIGLIVPVQEGAFDRQDVIIGQVIKKAMTYNIRPDDISFYARAAKALAEDEMKIRKRVSENLPVQENSAVTMELTQMARSFRSYVFDRTFQKRILSGIDVPNE